MRTIYARILIWGIVTLVLSLIAFVAISMNLSARSAGHGGPLGNLAALQVHEAAAAYESGGAAAAADYLARLNRFLRAEHYLTDARGRDLIDGEDRSALLGSAAPNGAHPPFPLKGRIAMAAASPDGRYRLLIVATPPFGLWDFVPYYLPILLVVAVACWLLAAHLASPLGELARAVERFGGGDLSARANFRRRDEIGELARAFDLMAGRIQTLLTAERQLLQDVSHELRSPLARMIFAAELTRTAEDRDAAAAKLRKEIDRLAHLVGALLQVTRAEGDPAAHRLEDVPLSELLHDLVDDWAPEAASRGCRIEPRIQPAVTVCGDRELIRRALENVISNSVRYAPAGTAVETILEKSPSDALLTVRDYGPGVPEELLPRLFTPFFRADASRDGATGGVGLGLAIAQRAIHLHHGSISARNAEPGLKVEIRIPLGPRA